MEEGSIFCVSLFHECSTALHARSREEGEEPPGGKEGFWVVMAAPAPILPLSFFFQPVLSGKAAEKVQGFQVIPILDYSLVQWENILKVLEAEALDIPMLSSDGIKRSKG